jgi:hypothetical protein
VGLELFSHHINSPHRLCLVRPLFPGHLNGVAPCDDERALRREPVHEEVMTAGLRVAVRPQRPPAAETESRVGR